VFLVGILDRQLVTGGLLAAAFVSERCGALLWPGSLTAAAKMNASRPSGLR